MSLPINPAAGKNMPSEFLNVPDSEFMQRIKGKYMDICFKILRGIAQNLIKNKITELGMEVNKKE